MRVRRGGGLTAGEGGAVFDDRPTTFWQWVGQGVFLLCLAGAFALARWSCHAF